MTISTILKTVYASAPDDVLLHQTVDIELPGGEHIRLVTGYENLRLGVDGTPQLFEACAMDFSLPAQDDSGYQSLQFVLSVEDHERTEAAISTALEQGLPVYLTYREYISTDTSAPARAPMRVMVLGGDFEEGDLRIEGIYFDMLNMSRSRERYTLQNAPGVKWL